MVRLSTLIMAAPVRGDVLNVTLDLFDGGAGLVLTAIVELAALWLYIVMWGRIVILDVRRSASSSWLAPNAARTAAMP